VFNLQGSEIIVILLLALVVLGPEKLPDAIRKFSRTYAEFKKMSSGFQSELKSALDEPMREMRETANLVRDAADPHKIIAEAEAEQRLRDDTARTAVPAADPVSPDPVSPDSVSHEAVSPDIDAPEPADGAADPADESPPR
jgi:sec-independent protein translocase protein TatB